MPRRRIIVLTKRFFVPLYLAALMGLFTVLFIPQGSSSGVGLSGQFAAAWAVLYVATAMLILTVVPRIVAADIPMFLLTGWILASTLWSPTPNMTLIYAGALVANICFLFVVRQLYSIQEFLELLLGVLVLLCILSLALFGLGVKAVQYVDIHQRLTVFGTEPIRGLFDHKITAGLYGVVGIVLAIGLSRGLRRVSGVTLFALFVSLTGSSAAIALIPVGVGLAWLTAGAARLRVRSALFILSLGLLAFSAAMLLLIFLPPLLEALNRDPTITGRTDLWRWGLRVFAERPITGWGFFGYFGTERAAWDAGDFIAFRNYEVPHFHNSYIQTLVDLGVVGLTITAAVLLQAIAGSLRIAANGSNRSAASMGAVVLLMLCAGVFMHVVFKYNSLASVSVLAAFVLTRAMPDEQGRLVKTVVGTGTSKKTAWRRSALARNEG